MGYLARPNGESSNHLLATLEDLETELAEESQPFEPLPPP